MRWRERWKRLSVFWQVYIFTAVLFGVVVTVIDGVVDGILDDYFKESSFSQYYISFWGFHEEWYEVVLWFVGVVIPTLSVSYFVATMVEKRLSGMGKAAKRLASGDFSARIEEKGGDDKDAFDQVARTFNRMAESLELATRNEKRLLADISHELRSPLTRMNVSTALLSKDKSPGERAKILQGLENDIAHMTNLVGLLLAQGRERSIEREVTKPIDISEIALRMTEKFDMTGRGSGKSFRASATPGLEVLGSGKRAELVLENILANALFYMPPGSVTEVTVAAEGESIRLSVRDHGPGVPDDRLEYIFRAFYRVDLSRARGSGGAGLGLALVNEAVLTMGGHVRARNADPGLEIVVTFPRAPRHA